MSIEHQHLEIFRAELTLSQESWNQDLDLAIIFLVANTVVSQFYDRISSRSSSPN